MCGALAIRLPSRVEQRAGEIEPLLDVDRVRGVLQRSAHLLGDRHEQVVEDLEHHRIDLGADRAARCSRGTTRSSTRWSSARDARLPAGLDHGGGVRLGDDRRARRSRRPARRSSRADRAASSRHAPPREHAHRRRGAARRARRCAAPARSAGASPAADRLDRRPPRRRARLPGIRKANRLRYAASNCATHVGERAERHDERRVGALVRRCTRCARCDRASGDALARELGARRRPRARRARVAARAAPASSSGASTACSRIARLVGEPHAVGREHAGERMDEHARHAERVGDQAGVLAAGAAEAAQRVLA